MANTVFGCLYGEGTQKHPYYVKGHKNKEVGSIKSCLGLCDEVGINRLNVAYSGRYYIRREDGWYLTSDTETCDQYYQLPAKGIKVM